MSDLKITKEAAIEAYQNVMDRIKTLEDALEDQGIIPQAFYLSCEDLTTDEKAYRSLKVIAKALNGDWEADFTDDDQWKYWPWFEVNNAGSAYSLSSYAPSLATATVGSRLSFKSRELAIYAGRQFKDIYNDFII